MPITAAATSKNGTMFNKFWALVLKLLVFRFAYTSVYITSTMTKTSTEIAVAARLSCPLLSVSKCLAVIAFAMFQRSLRACFIPSNKLFHPYKISVKLVHRPFKRKKAEKLANFDVLRHISKSLTKSLKTAKFCSFYLRKGTQPSKIALDNFIS